MILCHRRRRRPPPPIYSLSPVPIALHGKKKRQGNARDMARASKETQQTNERIHDASNRRLLVPHRRRRPRRRFDDMKRKENEGEKSIYVDKRGFDEI
jgi:hypothetical protein